MKSDEDDQSAIDDTQAFMEMGLDSIVGIEWVKEINTRFFLNINAAQLYDYPTLQRLSQFVHGLISPNTESETPTSQARSASLRQLQASISQYEENPK